MELDIRYLAEYVYDEPVSQNVNELRVLPAASRTQRCMASVLHVSPAARQAGHVDRFGTRTVRFGVFEPHQRLTIDARARVNTAPPDPVRTGGWSGLRAGGYLVAATEFLVVTEVVPPHPVVRELCTATGSASTPLEAVRVIGELIRDRFDYRPGATVVSSSLNDLLSSRAGVCQDFVHLALVVLRSQGVAARYVSGYLYTKAAETVGVQTHAWLEALLPSAGDGPPRWVGADPTNRSLAGEAHVKIGHGRSYRDVPPIRGVYRGSADAKVRVRATLGRRDLAVRPAP